MVLTASIPAYALPFTINATFDSSIPTNSAPFNSINSAIALFEKTFTDPITVNITFGFGSLSGGSIGQTANNITQILYSDYASSLKAGPRSADDSTALGILAPGLSIPVTDPITGNAMIAIGAANLRAAGITPAVVPIPDAVITFNSTASFYYRNTNTPNPSAAIQPSQYDFLAVVEHEINEALGIGSTLTKASQTPIQVEPLDLFRYAQNSTKSVPIRSFTLNTSARAFFSIDGNVVAGIPGALGTTPEFNNQATTADFNDWVTGTGVQDAITITGVIANLGPNEIRALDVIGYDLVGATPPTPSTPGPVTGRGVILSPTDAVINIGGTGLGAIQDTINQNGLSFGFISGTTDFDSYLTSTPPPRHTISFPNAEWFSASTIARVTYDLGNVYSVDRLALWNEEVSGIGKLDLFYSTDDLTFFSLASGLLPTDNTGSYVADVFSFMPTNARYIRFDMSDCPQPKFGGNNACAIGEVAFEVNPVAQAPEPGTLALFAVGLGLLGARSRRNILKLPRPVRHFLLALS
jgi:hypothetical protein